MRGSTPSWPTLQVSRWSPPVKQSFIVQIRQALVGCGLDPTKYAGHSFRIEAATSAASKGINDSTIKLLGRWESEHISVSQSPLNLINNNSNNNKIKRTLGSRIFGIKRAIAPRPSKKKKKKKKIVKWVYIPSRGKEW